MMRTLGYRKLDPIKGDACIGGFLLRASSRAAGKNKDTEHAEEDIREGVKRIGRFADYLVINLSSPNTKGLRALQQRDHLKSIITTAQAEIRNLEESDNSIRGQRKEEEKMQDGVNEMPEDLRLKGSDFFPTQTGRRPLLFVKIAVRPISSALQLDRWPTSQLETPLPASGRR